MHFHSTASLVESTETSKITSCFENTKVQGIMKDIYQYTESNINISHILGESTGGNLPYNSPFSKMNHYCEKREIKEEK